MSNQQISDKTVLTLTIISFFVSIIIIGWMIVSGEYKTENCWDKYSTEQEAIMNCEEH